MLGHLIAVDGRVVPGKVDCITRPLRRIEGELAAAALTAARELAAHGLEAVRGRLGALTQVAVRLCQVEGRQCVLVLEPLQCLRVARHALLGARLRMRGDRALEELKRGLGLAAVGPQHAQAVKHLDMRRRLLCNALEAGDRRLELGLSGAGLLGLHEILANEPVGERLDDTSAPGRRAALRLRRRVRSRLPRHLPQQVALFVARFKGSLLRILDLAQPLRLDERLLELRLQLRRGDGRGRLLFEETRIHSRQVAEEKSKTFSSVGRSDVLLTPVWVRAGPASTCVK